MNALTPKQKLFIDEYLVDLNAAAAAERAGYSKKTARFIGAENLTKPNIQAAVETKLAERAQKTEVTSARVIDELAAVAFSDVGDLMAFEAGGYRFKPPLLVPERARRAIASIKVRRILGGENEPAAEIVEIKLWDKVEALGRLAQHLGLLNELQGLLTRLAGLENGQVSGGAVAGSGPAPAGAGAATSPASRRS